MYMYVHATYSQTFNFQHVHQNISQKCTELKGDKGVEGQKPAKNTKEKLDYITVFTVQQTNRNKSTKLKAKGPISLLNHIQHINCSGWGQCRS